MISIKRNISFSVEVKKKISTDSNADKAYDGRLRCVVTWQGCRVRISVGYSINPKYWESSLQRCKARSTHGKTKIPASLINRDIDDLDLLINGIFTSFEEKETVPSKEEFLAEYNRLTTPENENAKEENNPSNQPLFQYYDEFVKDSVMSGRWSEGTVTKARAIRRHLFAISPNLTFKELNEKGATLLIDYFNKAPNFNKVGMSNSTIRKNIAFIKIFFRWAEEKGYSDDNRVLRQRVRIKTANRPVVFLSWDELMAIYHFNFGNKTYLAQVRDVFCFCCFTSLRYSDVYNLRRSNIHEDGIQITTIKTHDSLFIELNKYSRAILEKYEGIPFPNDKALPVISNQKMNAYLKELGQICGLDSPIVITRYKGTNRIDETFKKYELLSTHAARRTFISNALMLGVPADIVMKWTGHSDYKAMKPYIEIADNAKKSAMSVFDMVDSINQPNLLKKGGAKSGAKIWK